MMLEIKNLCVSAGSFLLEDFSLEIEQGQCLALMGPSGCGKTTILETLCGLRQARSGAIRLGGHEITHLPPSGRGIGLVPQDIALFPSLSVREQIAFGPKLHGWPEVQTQDRVDTLAQALGISQLLERMPLGLSGGESRRVALGRALALRPRLLCLDEALTGLDEERHGETLAVVREMIELENVTALHVTHSRTEAEAIADHVVRME